MKKTIFKPKEVEAKFVCVALPVRYDEEDIPNDFPLRLGDMWTATIEIDTGRIEGWPQGRSEDLYMKVCDEGSYFILDEDHKQLAGIESDYVPHGLIPGEYGDYVDFKINADGVITNWPNNPNLSAFFEDQA